MSCPKDQTATANRFKLWTSSWLRVPGFAPPPPHVKKTTKIAVNVKFAFHGNYNGNPTSQPIQFKDFKEDMIVSTASKLIMVRNRTITYYGTGKKKRLSYLLGNLVATNWPIEKALHAIGYNQIPT